MVDESDHFITVTFGALNIFPLDSGMNGMNIRSRAWARQCLEQKGTIRGYVPRLWHWGPNIVNDPDCAATAASLFKLVGFDVSSHPFIMPVRTIIKPCNSYATSSP